MKWLYRALSLGSFFVIALGGLELTDRFDSYWFIAGAMALYAAVEIALRFAFKRHLFE